MDRRPQVLDRAVAFVEYKPDSAGNIPTSVIQSIGGAMNHYGGFTTGATRDRVRNNFSPWNDVLPNQSIRDGMTRDDYSSYRPNEQVPKEQRQIIYKCNEAYRRVGIVRNVIDLMADFGAQGIKLVHPNRQIQKFYQGWFKKVGGPERSERFLNLLYRVGNLFVKRTMAKVSAKHERYLRSIAAEGQPLSADMPFPEPEKVVPRTIPIQYYFLNPMTIEPIGGDLAQFIGNVEYAIIISQRIKRAVTAPKNDIERGMVKLMDPGTVARIKKGDLVIPIDVDRLQCFFYKKDDWQTFADPMTYAILDDLILLEKMRLADLAALDGAISQVRVWKLGSLETNPPIFPTDAAVQKLADILMANTGGGAFDLIWGPELSVDNYETNVHQFLGGQKYEPVLNAIYAGLGVPPTLTGAATQSGMTNNYISLKTLVQRLEYGRSLLRQFWENEIEIVRKAMGFRFGAEVRFDRMVLSDEAAEKSLLLQMVDRNLVSFDTFVERFGESPELERLRLLRDQRDRERGILVPQASAWHDPEKQYQLTKLALTRTLLTPKQSGIDIEEEYDKAPFLMNLDILKTKAATGGGSSGLSSKSKGTGGRPKNSKDGTGVTRNRTPKALGELAEETSRLLTTMAWAKEAQVQISDILTPGLLEHFGKKNLRSLTAKEFTQAERIKFLTLANLKPFISVDAAAIQQVMATELKVIPQVDILYNKLYQQVVAKTGRTPSIDEERTIQAMTYSLVN